LVEGFDDMASRAKTTRSRKPAASVGGMGSRFKGVLKIALVLAIGLGSGYAWRSYFPLALPFESPLVADKSSQDVAQGSAMDGLGRRAREAEAERDSLARKLADLEASHRDLERELADMKIKSLLSRAD
jgi:hypothetical protein